MLSLLNVAWIEISISVGRFHYRVGILFMFLQDKILLKFKISYSLKDAMTTDIGEVQFPDGI